MRLALFGATGRTGRPLTEQALAAGHTVVALARDPSTLGVVHDRLTVVQGDVLDPVAVARVISPGTDAVLLTLGHTRGAPDDLMAHAARTVIAAMTADGVRRVVTETGAAVANPNDPRGVGSTFMRSVMGLVAKNLLADSEAHVATFRNSDLDWTALRAPRLTNGRRTGEARVGYFAMGPGQSVSRADVADVMLRLAASTDYAAEAPHVTGG